MTKHELLYKAEVSANERMTLLAVVLQKFFDDMSCYGSNKLLRYLKYEYL